MMAILDAAPNAKGIVFDEEYVVNKTKRNIATKEMSGRCTVEAGSFFDSVPQHADAYMLKGILHDWDDEKSKQILNNCAKAMKPERRTTGSKRSRPRIFLKLSTKI